MDYYINILDLRFNTDACAKHGDSWCPPPGKSTLLTTWVADINDAINAGIKELCDKTENYKGFASSRLDDSLETRITTLRNIASECGSAEYNKFKDSYIMSKSGLDEKAEKLGPLTALLNIIKDNTPILYVDTRNFRTDWERFIANVNTAADYVSNKFAEEEACEIFYLTNAKRLELKERGIRLVWDPSRIRKLPDKIIVVGSGPKELFEREYLKRIGCGNLDKVCSEGQSIERFLSEQYRVSMLRSQLIEEAPYKKEVPSVTSAFIRECAEQLTPDCGNVSWVSVSYTETNHTGLFFVTRHKDYIVSGYYMANNIYGWIHHEARYHEPGVPYNNGLKALERTEEALNVFLNENESAFEKGVGV